jgi:hypothetical protein
MDNKNLLWIGGGLAAVYLISKFASAGDYLKNQIKQTAENVKGYFEAVYAGAVAGGMVPQDVTFEKWPLYLIVIESPIGISGKSHVETAEGSGSEIELSSKTEHSIIPIPTTYRGKPLEKIVFDLEGIGPHPKKSITVFASAITPTNFGEMLSGDARYYKVTPY